MASHRAKWECDWIDAHPKHYPYPGKADHTKRRIIARLTLETSAKLKDKSFAIVAEVYKGVVIDGQCHGTNNSRIVFANPKTNKNDTIVECFLPPHDHASLIRASFERESSYHSAPCSKEEALEKAPTEITKEVIRTLLNEFEVVDVVAVYEDIFSRVTILAKLNDSWAILNVKTILTE